MKDEVVATTWARGIKKLKNVDIFQNTRKREVVTYRALHVVMCRKNLQWSLERIGRYYKDNGKKSYDHATALHAEKMFEIYCKYDKDLMLTMTALTGMTDDKMSKKQSLQAQINYIDPEFYSAIEGCLRDAFELTALKNQQKIQEEKDKKFYEIYRG